MTKTTAHANCTHDNSKAARAKCRRDRAKIDATLIEMTPDEIIADIHENESAWHCQLCGGEQPEPNRFNDGYSQCCNEPITDNAHEGCAHDGR